MRLILQRLWPSLLAPWHGLRALVQLPSLLRQWHTRLETQELLIRELTDLHRELLTAIGAGPQTPETPRLVPPFGAMPPEGTTETAEMPALLHPAPPPEPPNPHRLRTDRDVTYSSRSFLHEQDARAAAEQAPWRRPGTR